MGLASLPTGLILYGLGLVGGPLVAYNIFAFAAFPLSGLAMFLLVRRLTGSAWAGVLGGWALAFFPYAQIKGDGHYELAHSWVIVLALWRVLELLDRPSRRNGVLAGLAVVFAMAWTPYFILLAGITYAVVTIGGLAIAARAKQLRAHFPGQAITAAIVLAYLLTFYVLSASVPASQGGLRTNSVAELDTYSARPWEYLIPDRQNPVFGQLTSGWLTKHLHGSNFAESTLYLGISALILAGVAVYAAARRRLSSRLRSVTILAVLLVLVGGWISAPPHGAVLGVNVPFPSDLISRISSTWRVYARLVTVVMIGVSLLAGIGVAWLIRDRPRLLQIGIIVVAAAALVGVDFRPHRGLVNPTGPRLIDAKVMALPPGIVAEYPLFVAGTSYDALWDQQWEGHPVLDGYQAGTYQESRALSLADPSKPGTSTALAAIGVRYLLDPNNVTTTGLRFPKSDYRLLATDPSGSVYGVIPHGTEAVAAYTTDGFGAPEESPQGYFTWLEQPTGRIEVDGDCAPCRVVVKMTLTSFVGPRLVQIRDASGRLLYSRRLTTAPVSFPLSFNRSTRLSIMTRPGPIPIQLLDPTSPDTRSVSVSVLGPTVTPAPAH